MDYYRGGDTSTEGERHSDGIGEVYDSVCRRGSDHCINDRIRKDTRVRYVSVVGQMQKLQDPRLSVPGINRETVGNRDHEVKRLRQTS